MAKAGYETVVVVPNGCDETLDGVYIRAVPRSKNRWQRLSLAVWRVYRAALDESAQVYHFHDPALIPVGILLKFHRKLVIYDVHEDLPRQILGKYWIPYWLRRSIANVAGVFEIAGARIFDGIVTATPTIAKRFPQQKTITVHNFPIEGELVSAQPIPYAERPLLAAYVGQLEAIRGIKNIIQAMAMLPDTLNARLALMGRFDPPELEGELSQLPGWECVKFLGRRSREDVASLLSLARVGLVLLPPRQNFLEGYPVKLFEYMSVGIPVIASDFPLWRKIVDNIGCGILVDPLDPKAIAEAILWMFEHPEEAEAMGRRGQKEVHVKFNWAGEAKKLRMLYEQLCGATG